MIFEDIEIISIEHFQISHEFLQVSSPNLFEIWFEKKWKLAHASL